ncbi:MAG: DNA repair protein RecO [Sphingobacteriaceae bacterium]
MLHKTRGIVFKCTNYSESSVIVQVFTEKFGIQSYLINGVKKAKAKISLNMLQPLHLLDMVVYAKATTQIQRVAEIRQTPLLLHIPYDIVKSSLALFLNEVIYKSVRQQGQDEHLFEFIFHAIELLDGLEEGLANFHLYFLLRLTRFLGFFPDKKAYGPQAYFDLQSGCYSSYPPPHGFVIAPDLCVHWQVLIESEFEALGQLQLRATERRMLLDHLLDYYRLHVDHFGELKSQAVLAELFA